MIELVFGLKLVYPIKGRLKPYLSLRGIAVNVHYEVKESANIELSKYSDDSTFFTYGARIGIDIGLSKGYIKGQGRQGLPFPL